MDCTNELINRTAQIHNSIKVNERTFQDDPKWGPNTVIIITDNEHENNANVITLAGEEEQPNEDVITNKDEEVDNYAEFLTYNAEKSRLSDNIRNHLGLGPHKCPCCDKGFSSVGGLRIHAKAHHDLELQLCYICKICGQAFKTTHHLEEHLKQMHSNAIPHICNFCNEHFLSLSDLHAHGKTHLRTMQLGCKFCGKSFAGSSDLRDHTTKCIGKSVHGCSFCKKQFATATDLNDHMQVHLTQWKHKCKPCDKMFRCSADLNLHNLQLHAGNEQMNNLSKPIYIPQCATCIPCGKTFRSYGGLLYHKKRSHEGFACLLCDKKFSTHRDLQAHLHKNRKTKAKDKCMICSQDFNIQCHLSEHLRPDGMQAPYACEQCNYVCAYPCALELHRGQHLERKSTQQKPHRNMANDMTLEVEDDELLAFAVTDADTQYNPLKARVNAKGDKNKYIISFQKFIDEDFRSAKEQTKLTKEIKRSNKQKHTLQQIETMPLKRKNNSNQDYNSQPIEIKEETCDDFEEFQFICNTK